MKKFMLGCNYWASHAGIEMWNQWDPEQVDKDLALLKEYGITYLRVFPIWPHFQPLVPLYGPGWVKEHLLEGNRKPTNPWYLDDVMMDRFGQFCDIAEKHGMKLIIGLITGWMSGRLYVPQAVFGRNHFTDPFSLSLQQRFIKGFVPAFKDRECIYAWDLGNECNVMSDPGSRTGAYNWASIISNAIRAQDPDHPIVSGMHGLTVEGPWAIEDQAETTDILTTHPYSAWVPHCNNDPITSFRTLNHGTAESYFYTAIGKKPCLVEEIGTLGVNVCTNKSAADFLRANMFSNWANGNAGVLWWCAHEQNKLTFPPYNWNMMERGLGMTDENMQPKEYMIEMKKFNDWLQAIDFEIEAPKTDAMVLLSKGQDHWGMGYMTYLLGKQIGVNFEYLPPNTDIPERDFYILPSTCGEAVLYSEYYEQLKERVRNGATLYISNNDAYFTELEEFFGFQVIERENTWIGGKFKLGDAEIPYAAGRKIVLNPTTAEVLAKDEEGNPMLLLHKYGKGKIYFLNFPLESYLCPINRAFEGDIHKFYEFVLQDVLSKKAVRKTHPKVGLTENRNIITLVNYSDQVVDPGLTINGKEIDKIYRGAADRIEPFDAFVCSVK